MSPTEKSDHRSRVALEKRERMRARLVETALAVFAERGVGASVIQEVIALAQVSQGTFYNYFRTNEELLAAVAEGLSNELVQLIEGTVSAYADPAQRIAVGVRLYLHKAKHLPLFARFIARTGVGLVSPNNLVYEYVPPHLEDGFKAGRFKALPISVALDLISGAALAAVARLASGEAEDDYPELMVSTILRGLGVPDQEAQAIAYAPLAPLSLPADALAVRASQRFADQLQ